MRRKTRVIVRSKRNPGYRRRRHQTNYDIIEACKSAVYAKMRINEGSLKNVQGYRSRLTKILADDKFWNQLEVTLNMVEKLKMTIEEIY